MDSLSLVGGTLLGVRSFFAWPAALCRNVGRKRAHRLGALSSGLVPQPKAPLERGAVSEAD